MSEQKTQGKELLIAKGLKQYFPIGKDRFVRAVDGVDFSIREGEVMGLVGESGSGKSTIAYTVMGMYRQTDGEIIFNGNSITKDTKGRSKEFRRDAQIVFQDPGSSLNPYQDVRQILSLPLKVHNVVPKSDIDDKIREILQMVENEDVEFIRLQFTDMFGTLKNVAVTATQLQYMKDNRYLIDGSCMYGELRTGEEDMYLCPDLDTFVILPWRPQQGKVARLLCDVCRADGTPLAVSPREILKKTIEKVEKEGYTFQIDPECEFFLFHEDENGVPTTVTHEKAGYMDISPLDLGENARRDMVMTLEDMGFEIESSHHEKAPGQHEIDFRYAGAMETADRIVTFKTAVRSIAKRFGLYATFMPKPKAGTAGSGMHINISLFQNGKNIFSDPEAEDGLSQEAKWFMGGIMAHVKGMCAVTNPLVNSYKRLTSGCDAPRDIIWTTKNHNTLLRIPFMRGEDTRIELRFPDPSANAYLTIALCMAAGLDGIAKHLDPGAESARLFASRTEAEKAAAGIDHLPDTLREAVAFMEEDSFVKMVLGQEFVDLYVEAKKAEWNEYMSQVSEWEVDKYLYRT